MDHSHYAYSALPLREAGPWEPGAGLAASVVLFLEHWDCVPPEGAVRDPRMVGEFGSFSPDYRSWSQREYGLRVGIFRVIDALREAGIRPAIAANAMAVQRLPDLVRLFNDWGCEWIAHGLAATRMVHSGMSLAQEAALVTEVLETIERHTGKRPSGWVSQDWGTTPNTYAVLAGAGMAYTLDWCNDDQPFWLRTEPRLLSIPLSPEWDDVQCQWLRNIEPRAHAQLAAAAFARIQDECMAHQRAGVFGLALHPWLCGMPSRIAALRGLLSQLRARPQVWWADPGRIYSTLASGT